MCVCVGGGGGTTHTEGHPPTTSHTTSAIFWVGKKKMEKYIEAPRARPCGGPFGSRWHLSPFLFPFFPFFLLRLWVSESRKKNYTQVSECCRGCWPLLKWKRILEKKKKKSTTQVDTMGRGSLSSICVRVILFSSIFLQYIIKCSANLTPISTFFCVWPLEGLCAWARASVILFGRENRGDPGDIFSLVHPPYRMMMRVWTPFAFPSRDPSGATTFSIHTAYV